MNVFYINKNEDSKPVRTQIDLGLLEDAPQAKRSWLAWVFVKIDTPDESGWCVEQECDFLFRLQTDLTDELQVKLGAISSGVRMQDGWLELFFYLPTAKKFDNIAASVMKKYASYSFESGSSRDTRWDHYIKELYPDVLMQQQIQNRVVISELEDAGDDISLSRAVEHYLFFQTEAQRERAVDKLIESGFALKENVQQDGEYSYAAVMVKDHAVTEERVMDVTRELLDAVHNEHGMYEGWSTTLVT